MSATVTSILFSDEYTGVYSGNGSDPGLSHFKGCVGDLIWAKISLYVQVATLNTSMNFSASAQTITRKDCGGLGSFITDGFNVGDTIVVAGTGTANDTSYTITAVTASTITVSSGISVTGQYASVNVYMNNPFTTGVMDFYYNLIPTNGTQNFTSPTDVNSLQKFSGTVPQTYQTNLLNTNTRSLAWWDGSVATSGYYGSYNNLVPHVTAEGLTSDYKNQFTIVFPFLIKPFYTADQLQTFKDAFATSILQATENVDISNAGFTVPSYFEDGSTLNFLYQVDFRYTSSDVSPQNTTGALFVDGDVAWFNDLFPNSNIQGGVQKFYPKSAATYVDDVTALAVSTIDWNSKTNVTFSLVDTGFNANDILLLNFMWMPTNSSVYQNTMAQSNKANFRDVFMHDRCLLKVGAAPTNGDRSGSIYQSITLASANINIPNVTLDITFTIDFGSEIKNVFGNIDPSDLNFLIWVTPQFKAITSLATANRNSVMADVNLATTNTDNSSLLVIDTDGTTDVHYFRYPDVNVNPVTNYTDFVGAYSYAKCGFKIEGKPISIRVRFDCLVYDGGSNLVSQFNLEDWNNVVSGFWNGKFADIDIEQTRGFNLPSTDIRNTRSITRDATLDGGNYYGYKLIYGFQLAYQYWVSLLTSDEFSTYAAMYWAAFTQGQVGGSSIIPAGYSTKIQHIFTWEIEDTATGITTQFNRSCDVSAYDQFNGALPDAIVSISDQYGNDLSGLLASDIPCIISIAYDGHGVNIGVPPGGYSGVVGIMGIYYDNGTDQVFDWATSEGDFSDNTLWTSTPTVVINSATSVTVFANIDLSLATTPIKSYQIVQTLTYKV